MSRDSVYRIVSVGEKDYTRLIDFVQDAIRRKKITPNKLAIVSGIPAQSLYRFLSGQRGLEPSSITKLATGLGVQPTELHRLVEGGILGELSPNEQNEDKETAALRIQLISRFNALDDAGRQTLVNLAEALAQPPEKPVRQNSPTRTKRKSDR